MNVNITEQDIFKQVSQIINFPYPMICKHFIAANLLSMLEECGYPATEQFKALATHIVRAEDDAATNAIAQMQDSR
jgi:hypothetical protein